MLWIPIDRTLDMPLKRQVYEYIRNLILHGELQAGYRLPATREMAKQLGISRNVMIEAYEQLLAEGFINSQQGAGTFVAPGAFLEKKEEKRNEKNDITKKENKDRDIIDFRSGIPDLRMFPRKDWGRLAKEVCMDISYSAFGYDHPEGRLELRRVLAHYLRRTRGVKCHEEQIVVTSGATQAFSLITKLLLSEGDEVMIEDPITNEIQTIFTATGAALCPIPVDEEGMNTNLLEQRKKVKFIFVTPSHQFPLGSILPIQRRIQLIQFARENNCYIVEDDYDSEFRYDGEPIHSLQGLDSNRVIYVGTFSKNLSPSLRIGYIILPKVLIGRCKHLKWFHDLHTSSLIQITLARFIEEGLLERHIRKMRKVYMKRRKQLRDLLYQHFGETIEILGDSTGLHFIVQFKGIDFTEDLLHKIKSHRVKIYPVEHHSIQKGRHRNKIILGYGNLTETDIAEGVMRLSAALKNEKSYKWQCPENEQSK